MGVCSVADIFLDSAATGGADGTTWADAYTTLAAAIAGMSSGDTLAWANTSSESFSPDTVFTFPNGAFVISSTISGSTTITAIKATSPQLSGLDSGTDITINGGDGWWFGVSLAAGKSAIVRSLTLDSCTLKSSLVPGNSGATISLTANDQGVSCFNVDFLCDSINTNRGVVSAGSDGRVSIIGGSVSSLRTALNSGHTVFEAALGVSLIVDGVDCSGVEQEGLLKDAEAGFVSITRCRLNDLTTNLVSSTVPAQTQNITIDCTDSANTVNRQYKSDKEGELFSDTGIILDATNPSSATVSNKIVTNANAKEFFAPVRFSIINGWADFSTTKTIDIEFAQDGTTTTLTDTEIWIEVQYPDDTTSAFYLETDRAADNQSGANQASSSASWTGLSGTNVKQKCSVTTTQTGKQGIYQVFLCLAKPSTTVYVNPKADIS